MAEYLKREDLLDLYTLDDPELNENGIVALSVIRQNIRDLPSADVAPVVHGKVTHVIYMPHCKNGTCNVCGAYIQAWNYCPNCGAKMDLEASNES